ncbi:hypothetical protein D7D25_16710 [Proteiniphilum sp. X52]|nr:hypothetical protein D7D25_16710 [Proteiniphilum sp. X52]
MKRNIDVTSTVLVFLKPTTENNKKMFRRNFTKNGGLGAHMRINRNNSVCPTPFFGAVLDTFSFGNGIKQFFFITLRNKILNV